MLPPGWDASPSQGYPQHYAGTHLYTWVERGTKNATQCPPARLFEVVSLFFCSQIMMLNAENNGRLDCKIN